MRIEMQDETGNSEEYTVHMSNQEFFAFSMALVEGANRFKLSADKATDSEESDWQRNAGIVMRDMHARVQPLCPDFDKAGF